MRRWAGKFFMELVILLCISSSFSVFAQSPGHEIYKQGEALLRQGKLEEALGKFNNALVEEPSNYLYHAAKGNTLLKLKKLDLALTSLQRSVYYKEDYGFGYKLMGDLYLEQNDLDKAISFYSIAFKNESELSSRVKYKSELIRILIDREKYTQAETQLEELMGIAPYNSESFYLLGELSFAVGDLTEAIRGYKKALEYNKEVKPEAVARIYYGLGRALYQSGDGENAKKAWAKANFGEYKKLVAEDMARLNPDYYYKLGVSYYMSGDLDEAVIHLKKAIDMRQDFAIAYKYLGIISDKRDLTTEANSYFARAVQCEKDSIKRTDIYMAWLISQVENENHAGAITSAEKVIKIQPQNAKAWLLKSQSEFQLSRFSNAIVSAEKGLAALNNQDPVKRAPYNFIIGMSSKYTGNPTKAKEAFTNALFGNTKYAAKHELDVINGVIQK